jgi:molybdenum cofactor cytidylyltransferase
VGIVLLAAGGSTRMGRPKQLLPFRGTTLLRHAARTALATGCAPLVVVLGGEAPACRQTLEGLAFSMAENADWEQGMAGSIRCGIKMLEQVYPEVRAALILVHDQPLITPEMLQKLVALWKPPDIRAAAAFYGGSVGVPAVFDRALFAELKALSGAEGAKKILLRGGPAVASIEMPEALVDIDRPEDYRRVQPLLDPPEKGLE